MHQAPSSSPSSSSSSSRTHPSPRLIPRCLCLAALSARLPQNRAARLSLLATLTLLSVLLVRALFFPGGDGRPDPYFVRDYGHQQWFTADLPPVAVVQSWPEAKRDAALHALSRWNFSPEAWRGFVHHTVSALGLPPLPSAAKPAQKDGGATAPAAFTFAEIGCGVGAFSRTLLQDYPQARMEGVDLVPLAVEIARVVLPQDRATVVVGDAAHTGLPSDSADFLMLPGVICYLDTHEAVLRALAEIVRVGKDGSAAVLTMVPESEAGKGSCLMAFPRAVWAAPDVRALGLTVKEVQDMEGWECCKHHGNGRYAVTLTVSKKGATRG